MLWLASFPLLQCFQKYESTPFVLNSQAAPKTHFSSEAKWGLSQYQKVEQGYQCEKCSKLFKLKTRPSNLVEHLVKVHKIPVPDYLVALSSASTSKSHSSSLLHQK